MKLTIKRSELFSKKGIDIPFYDVEDLKKVLTEEKRLSIAKKINEIKGAKKNESN